MPSTAAAARLAGLPSWRRWWARPWRRCSWATWRWLLVTSTSSTRPPWAARSTWPIRGFPDAPARPVQTLTQITALLRPGGWVVAHEALRSPPPRSHPHLDALGTYWDLLHELVERAGGVPHGAVDGLA